MSKHAPMLAICIKAKTDRHPNGMLFQLVAESNITFVPATLAGLPRRTRGLAPIMVAYASSLQSLVLRP